jgi:hypothetical protein
LKIQQNQVPAAGVPAVEVNESFVGLSLLRCNPVSSGRSGPTIKRGANVLHAGCNVARNHHAPGKFSPLNRIALTVQKVDLLVKGLRRIDPLMFEAITAFLIVLSVGILIAHALDAFRHWS